MEYGDKHILVLGAGASGIGASWVLAWGPCSVK